MIKNSELWDGSQKLLQMYNHILVRCDKLYDEIEYQKEYWAKFPDRYNEHHKKEYEYFLQEYELLQKLCEFYEENW